MFDELVFKETIIQINKYSKLFFNRNGVAENLINGHHCHHSTSPIKMEIY